MMRYSQPHYTMEDLNSIGAVLASGVTAGVTKVREFEQACAEYVEAKYAVAVCNATMGLYAAYHIVQREGLVSSRATWKVPNLTFHATLSALLHTRPENPVEIVGVHPVTLTYLNTDELSVPVSFAGRGVNGGIIHDDAHGFKHGMWSQKLKKPLYSVVSYHAIKQLGLGEGGMVFTDSFDAYMLMKNFVYNQRTCESPLGLNLRMSDITAALGLSKLWTMYDEWQHKQALAHTYTSAFEKTQVKTYVFPPDLEKDSTHAFHLYVLGFEHQKLRDAVQSRLEENNIETRIHYPPLTSLCFDQVVSPKWEVVVQGDDYYNTHLSIPLHAGLTVRDCQKVVRIIKEIV